MLGGQEQTNPILALQNRKASLLLKGQQRVCILRYQFSIYPRNILDPPPITYTTNITDLIIDWLSLDCKAALIINSLRIPLAH